MVGTWCLLPQMLGQLPTLTPWGMVTMEEHHPPKGTKRAEGLPAEMRAERKAGQWHAGLGNCGGKLLEKNTSRVPSKVTSLRSSQRNPETSP